MATPGGDTAAAAVVQGREIELDAIVKPDSYLQAVQGDKAQNKNTKPWQPYENTLLAYSAWAPLVSALKFLLPWRWAYIAPLHHRTLFGKRVSIGALIMAAILIGLLVWGGVAWFGSDPGSSGNPAGLAMALTLLVVGHHSVTSILLGMPFESNLRWHMWLGNVTTLLSFNHGVHAMWAQGHLQWKEIARDSLYLTGWIATFALIPLFFTARGVVRRRFFEFFFYNHWLWFLISVIAALAHGAGIVVFGLIFWGADFLYRSVLMRLSSRPHTALLEQHPANVVSITFDKKDFHYSPGQYAFVCIPQLSHFQFHPFSFSSSPHHDKVSLHVRVLGNWTKKLYDLAKGSPTVKILIDGPAGQAHVDVEGPTYKHFLLVSGGIGITPMQSIANSLIDQQTRGRPIEKIFFVWSVADKFMLDAIQPKKEGSTDDVAVLMEDADKSLEQKVQADGRLPLSFQPDILERHQWTEADVDEFHVKQAVKNYEDVMDKGFLHTQFHLTRARPPSFHESGRIRPHLQRALRFGHPDFGVICRTMANIAKGERVAVLTCGPIGMINALKVEVDKYPTFDFHSEKFLF